jgi:hypothetical protein
MALSTPQQAVVLNAKMSDPTDKLGWLHVKRNYINEAMVNVEGVSCAQYNLPLTILGPESDRIGRKVPKTSFKKKQLSESRPTVESEFPDVPLELQTKAHSDQLKDRRREWDIRNNRGQVLKQSLASALPPTFIDRLQRRAAPALPYHALTALDLFMIADAEYSMVAASDVAALTAQLVAHPVKLVTKDDIMLWLAGVSETAGMYPSSYPQTFASVMTRPEIQAIIRSIPILSAIWEKFEDKSAESNADAEAPSFATLIACVEQYYERYRTQQDAIAGVARANAAAHHVAPTVSAAPPAAKLDSGRYAITSGSAVQVCFGCAANHNPNRCAVMAAYIAGDEGYRAVLRAQDLKRPFRIMTSDGSTTLLNAGFAKPGGAGRQRGTDTNGRRPARAAAATAAAAADDTA